MRKIKTPRSHPQQAAIDLPEGWDSAPVGDLLELPYGKALKQENRHDGPVAVYGSNGVVGHHDAALTDGPTIVIGRKGTVGAVHFSEKPCWPIDTTYYLDHFSGLDVRFLVHALRSLGLPELDTSSAIPGLNRDDIYAQVLTIPPLAEQKRIVAKVEELLTRVDAARERLARVPRLLKRFRQSVLAAACSGQLTADWRESIGIGHDTWRMNIPLADLCETIMDGDHLPPPQVPSGIPFLTIGNISSGKLSFDDTRFVREDYFAKLKPGRIPRPGDVLYTVVGATIGIPVLVDVDRPFCFQRHIAILKPSKSLISRYLYLLLGTRDVFRESWERVTGSAQPTLPLGGLRAIPVSAPPVKEQHEIVRRVEALLTLADKIEARVQLATARVEKITQSILAKAFRGEIVPTEAELSDLEGREYESATLLLARIQKERESQAAAKISFKKGNIMAKSRLRIKSSATVSVRRPLLNVFADHKRRLTPEELFQLAGYDDEAVDAFYEELRALTKEGKIRELRPNTKDVFLEAAKI